MNDGALATKWYVTWHSAAAAPVAGPRPTMKTSSLTMPLQECRSRIGRSVTRAERWQLHNEIAGQRYGHTTSLKSVYEMFGRR